MHSFPSCICSSSVSSDECLNFAVRNRAEWEHFGERIVGEMVEELQNTQELCDEVRDVLSI